MCVDTISLSRQWPGGLRRVVAARRALDRIDTLYGRQVLWIDAIHYLVPEAAMDGVSNDASGVLAGLGRDFRPSINTMRPLHTGARHLPLRLTRPLFAVGGGLGGVVLLLSQEYLLPYTNQKQSGLAARNSTRQDGSTFRVI